MVGNTSDAIRLGTQGAHATGEIGMKGRTDLWINQ